jgi:hypothetical protein
MTFYTHIRFLGSDYCDVDIEYDVIDGDPSVGFAEDYEFTATTTDEHGNEIDITDDLTREEIYEVIEAIKKDLKDEEYNNAID